MGGMTQTVSTETSGIGKKHKYGATGPCSPHRRELFKVLAERNHPRIHQLLVLFAFTFLPPLVLFPSSFFEGGGLGATPRGAWGLLQLCASQCPGTMSHWGSKRGWLHAEQAP